MIAETRFSVGRDPRVYAKAPAPTEEDWEELWAIWDLVTRSMIPEKELLSKPIHLRNCCIFYLGHIPAFLDKHLTRATGGKPTEPAQFETLFERGIDPDVENPEHCHAHSEIPEEWPPLETILEYQRDVRAGVRSLYKSGATKNDRRVARSLWLGMEHEGMLFIVHTSTL
jgi:L-histidine Nalpha-methyltransferase / hercynylcysteine S-oxide synthase